MEVFRASPNPVGEPKLDEGVEAYVQIMAAEWDSTKEVVPWWKFWKKISFVHVTDFLLKALDDLIAYVDEFVDTKGEDKKATVLVAVSSLYDYVAKEAMPIWLKPVSGAIKTYIVYHVLNSAIDWIVDKYRNGDWRKPEASELVAQWKIQAQSFGLPFGNILPK